MTEKSESLKKLSDKLADSYSRLKEDGVMDTTIKLFHTPQMRELLEAMINDSENDNFSKEHDGNYIKDYINALKNIIKICNSIYNYTGMDTGLSDSEYDELYEFYKDLSGDESIITEELVDTGDVVHHKYKSLRGTLDKIYKMTDEDILKNKSQKSLDDWVNQTEKRYQSLTGETINLMNEQVIVMPKFDGVSIVFECDKDGEVLKAKTRGDTSRNEAQDVTHIFKGWFKSNVKIGIPHGLKTEVMMLNQDLDAYNEKYGTDYKNTRSIVSSIINSNEKDERVEYLQIVPLRYSFLLPDGTESRQELAPDVYNYPYLTCKLSNLDDIHNFAFEHKTVFPGLRCDGAVIQLLNQHVQEVLGRKDNKQKYEVAFKYTEEKEYSKVIDVIFTTGLFGRINPVVVFEPRKMKGNEIRKASLGSYDRFKKLGLCKGDVIKILYDIIPYVDFDSNDHKCVRSGKKEIEAPAFCQDCGEPLELSEDGGILRCVNKKCPCRLKGKILNFCKKMNIGNISFATVDDFYEEGYLTSLTDLYRLKDFRKKLIKIDGYGDKKIDLILNEIENHRTVDTAVMLGSLGIENFSIKKFEKVLDYISLSELLSVALDKNVTFFTVIPGIKEKSAKILVDGINDNLDVIKFLSNELTLKDKVKADFHVVFTKVRDKELEDYIAEIGGDVSDNVTKNTDVVIVPNLEVDSGKIRDAKKRNIPIVPISEAKKYIEDNFA